VLLVACGLLTGVRTAVLAAPPSQGAREVDVVLVVDQINRWQLSTFRGYQFKKWISLGDVTRFNERIADGDVQVYIDTAQLKARGANALYEDCVGVGCSTYMNDIIIGDTPDKIPGQTLWHEAMHAIFDAHDSELLVSSDETYAWYMEGVINNALPVLVQYEGELKKGASCDQKKLEQYWSLFEKRLKDARNTVEGQITSDAQIQQLQQLTGFSVDAAAIRQGYVAAGLDKCPAAKSATATSGLDLIFCIDVTGSMEDDIAGVKAAASDIVNTIAAKSKDYRVAIIAYRDWNDSKGLPMFEDYAFSSSKDTIIANINRLSVDGGDDTPEAVFEALMRAIDSSKVGGWRAGVNKQVILMGDAPPHNPSRDGLTPAIVAKAAEDADPVVIQTLVVGLNGAYDQEAVNAFKELAKLTGGNSFEAIDASKVPEALQKTITVIDQPKAPTWLSTASWLLFGGLCLGLLLIVGVVGLVLLLSGGKRRRASQAMPAYGPAQAAPPYPQQPYPPQYAPPQYPAPQYPPPQYQAPPPPASQYVAPQYVAPQYQTTPPPASQYVAPAPQPAPYAAPTPSGHWQGQTMMASAMNVAELVIEGGVDVGQRFPLKAQMRLGRADDNDIVLRDAQASRYHALITLTGTEYVIADLGSANGTKVNGASIRQPCALHPNDVVTIGAQQLRMQQR
jgi:Mg-chelatase subunit ChlD